MGIKENIYYNSHDDRCKLPFGAVCKNTDVDFKVIVNDNNKDSNLRIILYYYLEDEEIFDSLELRLNKNKILSKYLEKDITNYITNIRLNNVGLYFYYFKVVYIENGEEKVFYISNSCDSKGGLGVYAKNLFEVTPFQITVYEDNNITPSWYKNAIFYQIFPDRFYNGNDDKHINSPKKGSFIYGSWEDSPVYIKNSEGAIERWDFFGGNLKGITKKLDYLQKIGINAIYLNPIFKARSNHRYDTGDYHKIDEVLGSMNDFEELIQEAFNRGINIILDGVFNHTGKDSKYFNIYNNYDDIGAYNSKESSYYDWYDFIEYPKKYNSWWGIDDLPNINENSPSFRNFILNENDGVVPYWIKKGVKGWRLDVADELPDSFIFEINKAMKNANKETVLLGEVWEDATNKIAYDNRRKYLLGNELNSVMNYPYKNFIIDYLKERLTSEQCYRNFMSIKENYPIDAFYSNFNFLGTHDTKRIITELEDETLLKTAIFMLFTLPGVPSIYYGDEVGLFGGKDPDNRKTYPWGRENLDILDIYMKAINYRKSSSAFVEGDFQPFFNNDIFGYFRLYKDETYIILINSKKYDLTFNINDCKNSWPSHYLNLIKNFNNLNNIYLKSKSHKIIKIN